MCERHSTLREYGYHFRMICDKCWKEDRYMHTHVHHIIESCDGHTHHITHVLTVDSTELHTSVATGGGKRPGAEGLLAAEANEATT